MVSNLGGPSPCGTIQGAHSALYLYDFNRSNTPKKLRVFIDYLQTQRQP
ncbi:MULTISPECIES: hypothetical protein [Pseudomonas]|nr:MULTISPECIES: hypothetical protein [Pseudomonas]